VSGFGISHEAMLAGADAVEEAQQAMTEHLGTLRSEVRQMTSGWRGEAAALFTNVDTSFEQNADRINSALDRIHEALVAQDPDRAWTSGT
jgi:WXG100 family type VII secretion target